MARRQSRRLQGLLPEVPTTRFTCFCLLEGDAADLGVIQTTCCRQFLHQSCQRRWLRSHSTCPLCRHDQTHPPAVPDGQPPRLNNAAIIDRLSRLLTDPNLDQILSRVRTFFFFFVIPSPLPNRAPSSSPQLPFHISRGEYRHFIYHLAEVHLAYENGETPFPHFLVEVLHTSLTVLEITGILDMLNHLIPRHQGDPHHFSLVFRDTPREFEIPGQQVRLCPTQLTRTTQNHQGETILLHCCNIPHLFDDDDEPTS